MKLNTTLHCNVVFNFMFLYYLYCLILFINRLTTNVLVKLKVYSLSLSPSVLSPPNNTAVSLVTDARVNSSIGGGLSPVTAGEIHSPK